MPRVMVFIDGSNLYHGLRENALTTRVDFGKLGGELAGPDRDLVRVYYYNVALLQHINRENYEKQQAFLASVRQQDHVRVVLGRLEPRGDVLVEKGVDTRIVVDMLLHASKDNYEVAILVSGDGDFACACEAVGELGKTVENAYFARGRSQHLQNFSDVYHEITAEILERCSPDR